MITSVHNPKIQWVRKLQTQAKARREQAAFVIEGVRLAEEALQSGWKCQVVLCSDELSERGHKTVKSLSQSGALVEEVTPAVMKSASQTESPQGLLAVLELHPLPLPPSPDFLLILDGVREPGNLGTILRTAAAADVQAVLLAPGTTDAYAPKVVRSAMGAHFRLPVAHLEWDAIKAYLDQSKADQRPQVYLADTAAGLAHTQANLVPPLALIVGGEAAGAGRQAAGLAQQRLHIPMPGKAESLNAAIAAAILMYEVVRQRGIGTR